MFLFYFYCLFCYLGFIPKLLSVAGVVYVVAITIGPIAALHEDFSCRDDQYHVIAREHVAPTCARYQLRYRTVRAYRS